MLILPDVLLSAVIVEPASSRAVVLPMPVAAFKSIVAAVTKPTPLMLPTLLIVTSSASAVVVPVRITFPLVVVLNTMSPTPPAVTLVVMVRFPPSLDKVMLSSPANGLPSVVVETVPKLTPPAPKFSNKIVPPPAVVSVVTTTAPAKALSMLILPDVLLSAVIVEPPPVPEPSCYRCPWLHSSRSWRLLPSLRR